MKREEGGDEEGNGRVRGKEGGNEEGRGRIGEK